MKILIFLVLIISLVSCSSADERVAYWENELNKSLTSDSGKQDVFNYLKNSGLEYGYFEHTKTFVAFDVNVENYIIVNYSVGINIELDENEKLQHIKVFKTSDGP